MGKMPGLKRPAVSGMKPSLLPVCRCELNFCKPQNSTPMNDLNWKTILAFSDKGNPAPDARVEKTEAEWKAQLSEEAFYVTRKHGTERPFSGEHCHSFGPGRYACICCGTLLFDAAEKFESGTGWPSFTRPVKENAIRYKVDRSFGMVRVETLCNTCDAHLGHVFPDGPRPTGLRYCMNSVALQKLPE